MKRRGFLGTILAALVPLAFRSKQEEVQVWDALGNARTLSADDWANAPESVKRGFFTTDPQEYPRSGWWTIPVYEV